jgi:hypothetical protein
VDAVLNCSSGHGPFYATLTPADTSQTVEVYVRNQAWLAVLVIASTLLLLISIVGTCTKWMTISPDVLGYVSSLTRDNPLTPEFGFSSAMDGLECTKAFGGLRIKLEDVNSQDQYGHVAVSTVNCSQSERDTKLQKGRLYI